MSRGAPGGRRADETRREKLDRIAQAPTDVLIVYEPENGRAEMATTGAMWAGVLSEFLDRNGVVVVCDFNAGAWSMLNSGGLMSVSDGGAGTSGTNVDVVLPSDRVVESVGSPYRAPNATGFIVLSETDDSDVVVRDPTGRAVVVHGYR